MGDLLRVLRFLLTFGVSLWLATILLIWVFQERLVFPGAYGPRSVPTPASLEAAGFLPQQLITADGHRLAFWAAPPRPDMPVLLLFHGNGIVAAQHGADMQSFADAGYGVVLAEYRGYGGNPGPPGEPGILSDALRYGAFVAAHWPQAKLVVWGESIGSASAIALAGQQPVAGVILDAPFTSLKAAAQWHFPWLPVAPLLRSPFDNLTRIGQVQAPLLMMQGAADTVVPPAQGMAIFAAAPCRATALSLPGVGHPAFVNDNSGRARQAVYDFLTQLRAGTLVCNAAAQGAAQQGMQ